MVNEDEVRNLNIVATMLGSNSEYLTVRTSDLKGALSELHRLQRVESALLNAIDWKMAQVEAARLAGNQAAREGEIEEKIIRRNEEREIRAEAYQLSLILEGKEIG